MWTGYRQCVYVPRLTVLLFVVGTVSLAANADPPKNVPSLDDDFSFIGEYAGHVFGSGGSDVPAAARVGLQVVPHGDGKFSAVYYGGGLPGSGWDRSHRWSLHGNRQGSTLVLEDEDWLVQIRGLWATVFKRSGEPVARLKKRIRISGTLGQAPPPEAVVLFDGSHTRYFRNGRMNDEGLLEAGADVVPLFEDYVLHAEFRVPYMPNASNQGRGNSGIYLQSRYEVQILDSFGQEGKANECGGLYRYRAPDVNMTLAPLAWQTYDITFYSPRFDAAGKKLCPARITVRHNNVVIHDWVAITRKTGAGSPEGPECLPIKFQEHGSPVQFRNIWIVDLKRPPCPALHASHGPPFHCAHLPRATVFLP